MNKTEETGLAIDFALSDRQCAFTGCPDKAADVYGSDFSNGTKTITLTYPVCAECFKSMRDIFSAWIPVFCTKCSSAAWMERNNGKIIVQDVASVVFSEGCPRCSEISEKVWCL